MRGEAHAAKGWLARVWRLQLAVTAGVLMPPPARSEPWLTDAWPGRVGRRQRPASTPHAVSHLCELASGREMGQQGWKPAKCAGRGLSVEEEVFHGLHIRADVRRPVQHVASSQAHSSRPGLWRAACDCRPCSVLASLAVARCRKQRTLVVHACALSAAGAVGSGWHERSVFARMALTQPRLVISFITAASICILSPASS